MQFSHEDVGHDRIATIDIETTHYIPDQGETVSVGLGVHDRDTPLSEASYDLFHRNGDDETEVIQQAIDRLEQYDADALVSYKGRDFDIDFLTERCRLLDAPTIDVTLDTPDTHIDLYEGRERRAEQLNEKWPSLEECLESYGFPTPKTVWNGGEITNVRFGEEVGPAYLDAHEAGDTDSADAIKDAIEHYLITDLEANLALYYSDIGAQVEPALIGTEGEF